MNHSQPDASRRMLSFANKNSSIFYENMRSVMSVKNELLRTTSLANYDVITITKTWLNESQYNNEFMSNRYRVFRRDRYQSTISAKTGGGVLIAVLEDIDYEEYTTPAMKDIEAVCVRFPLPKRYLFIHCLYIQPDAIREIHEAHINAMNSIQLASDDMILVVGDFN